MDIYAVTFGPGRISRRFCDSDVDKVTDKVGAATWPVSPSEGLCSLLASLMRFQFPKHSFTRPSKVTLLMLF